MPQIRSIAPIAVPEDFVRARIGARPRIVAMKPGDLSVDGAYQRDLSKKSLKLIHDLVADWDWRRYKVPVVAKVGDEWHVIDGQHTAIAAVTHGGIDEIDVMVVEAEQGSDRARAFIGHNKDRVPITNTQLFFAAAASGDEDALTAIQVCERAGATILRNPSPGRPFRPGELIAVAALIQLIRRRSALKARQVIETLVAARAAPISADMIQAVDTVLHGENFGEVEPEGIVAALDKFGTAIAVKSTELALAKKMRRAKALAIVIYQHTRKRRPKPDERRTESGTLAGAQDPAAFALAL